jgi:uncharacterized protein (TIGR03118 family)
MRVLARGLIVTGVLALAGLAPAARAADPSPAYLSHAIVGSTATLGADRVDPNLINPWGLVSSATSPWWTANNGNSTSTLYPATGAVNPLVVATPPLAGAPAPHGPTGIVFGGVAGAFLIPGGQSSFIFATEDGQLQGWRAGNTATSTASKPGAVYKGLAIATPAGGTPQLYATDFHNGTVDIYSSTWQLVSSDKFADPTLPAGYAPYGIQTVGQRIFVSYAQQDAAKVDEVPGAGKGYVSVFDTAGNFLARVASAGPLSAPWGLAVAPQNFGTLSGDVLVGNFGDGRINAFKETSPGTFAPDGTMQSTNGLPLVIVGLWALEFGSGGANNGATTALFYTAGPFNQTEGVFGRITNASTAQTGVTANVPAQLSLSLGNPASFGAFTAGLGKDYSASTTATVVSTAGDGALSVTDPSPNAPGHLVNGTFSLPQAVQASATSAGGTGTAFAPVSGTPTMLLTYTGPVSNDAVTLNFKQTIGANDALRTGTYSKTLTFTLSTTNP